MTWKGILERLSRVLGRPPASPPVPPTASPPFRLGGHEVVDLVMEIIALRAMMALPPLGRDRKLDETAQAHSERMAASEMMSHQLDGESPLGQRLMDRGYRFRFCAECIASGQTTAAKVVSNWFEEAAPHDGHRKVLLSLDYANVGCGFARGKSGVAYWTADFATALSVLSAKR